jgi:hypothetical protein
MVDISEGGMQIYHETGLPRGARVSVRIRHPRSYSETRLRGNVAWSMPSGIADPSQRYAIGIQFGPMSTGEIGKIRRLMETIRKRPGPKVSGPPHALAQADDRRA